MRDMTGNLNRTSDNRTVFARLTFATRSKGKDGTFPFECGAYQGQINQLQLLEDTVAAIEAEIERLKAK